MHTCMHTYIHTYTCRHTPVFTFIHGGIWANGLSPSRMSAHIHIICKYIHLCISCSFVAFSCVKLMFTCVCIYIYICEYILMHTHAYIHTYIYIYIYLFIFFCIWMAGARPNCVFKLGDRGLGYYSEAWRCLPSFGNSWRNIFGGSHRMGLTAPLHHEPLSRLLQSV